MKRAALKQPSKPVKPRNVVQVVCPANGDEDAATAQMLTRPTVQAASVIQQFSGDNHEINALIRELQSQVAAVHRGELARAEAMLIAQAHTLEEIFASLARRSQANIGGGYLDAAERYMRLALKAQSQCRTTLETLAEIKNPRPVAFVRQANIANGPQQVNNAPRAREDFEDQSNELSGEVDGLLPNNPTSALESPADPPLEALAEINRAKIGRREGTQRA